MEASCLGYQNELIINNTRQKVFLDCGTEDI